MRLLLIFIVISFSGNTQNNNSVVIAPTAKKTLDSTVSYVYCATMEIMWNELSHYLGEKPKSSIENSSIELLNESVSKNYQAPIEDEYVVANSGLIKDSIIDWSQSYHKVNTLRCSVSSLKKKDENIRVQPVFPRRKQL